VPGQFRPADHSKGDANTIGGYAAVHARPAAFEGSDGLSYSVEIETDETGDASRPVGGFLLFLRWRRVGEPGVEGHLETPFLSYGATADEARDAVGALSLSAVRGLLEECIRRQPGGQPARRWWDAMREEE
jgi:hypothetical protein